MPASDASATPGRTLREQRADAADGSRGMDRFITSGLLKSVIRRSHTRRYTHQPSVNRRVAIYPRDAKRLSTRDDDWYCSDDEQVINHHQRLVSICEDWANSLSPADRQRWAVPTDFSFLTVRAGSVSSPRQLPLAGNEQRRRALGLKGRMTPHTRRAHEIVADYFWSKADDSSPLATKKEGHLGAPAFAVDDVHRAELQLYVLSRGPDLWKDLASDDPQVLKRLADAGIMYGFVLHNRLQVESPMKERWAATIANAVAGRYSASDIADKQLYDSDGNVDRTGATNRVRGVYGGNAGLNYAISLVTSGHLRWVLGASPSFKFVNPEAKRAFVERAGRGADGKRLTVKIDITNHDAMCAVGPAEIYCAAAAARYGDYFGKALRRAMGAGVFTSWPYPRHVGSPPASWTGFIGADPGSPQILDSLATWGGLMSGIGNNPHYGRYNVMALLFSAAAALGLVPLTHAGFVELVSHTAGLLIGNSVDDMLLAAARGLLGEQAFRDLLWVLVMRDDVAFNRRLSHTLGPASPKALAAWRISLCSDFHLLDIEAYGETAPFLGTLLGEDANGQPFAVGNIGTFLAHHVAPERSRAANAETYPLSVGARLSYYGTHPFFRPLLTQVIAAEREAFGYSPLADISIPPAGASEPMVQLLEDPNKLSYLLELHPELHAQLRQLGWIESTLSTPAHVAAAYRAALEKA